MHIVGTSSDDLFFFGVFVKNVDMALICFKLSSVQSPCVGFSRTLSPLGIISAGELKYCNLKQRPVEKLSASFYFYL